MAWMYVKGAFEEGAAYGTSREGGRWSGENGKALYVMPCGPMAGHSFLIVHTLQEPQQAPGPTDLDLSAGSNDFLGYETCGEGSGCR